MKTNHPNLSIPDLIKAIDHLRSILVTAENDRKPLLEQVQPHYYDSARNLIHYMAMRSTDLRDVQEQLSALSISSISHSEGYVLSNLSNILVLLQLLQGEAIPQPLEKFHFGLNYGNHKSMLKKNSLALFGDKIRPGSNYIMVTMPSEAASDYSLIQSLMAAGMNIARINTCHDTPEDWEKMIENIRKAAKEFGRSCKVYMDLAGPKLRTGPIKKLSKWQSRYKQKPGSILLQEGSILFLHKENIKGEPAVLDNYDRVIHDAKISTTLPEIFDFVKPGEQIAFDDGKIYGIIRETWPDKIKVEITFASQKGAKLCADKGINLPDTKMNLPPLADQDLENLPFIAENADMIGFSFVQKPSDVSFLYKKLEGLNKTDIGLILKVETQESFTNLPLLILEAMKYFKVGAMIARGDLAVELGFDRISEVQEEILWICESASIPGIWATQVMENLAKQGVATRAEITDAAMSTRAECVMLNKGPYITDAVKTLDNIMRRMHDHLYKRKGNLRPLHVARHFMDATVRKG